MPVSTHLLAVRKFISVANQVRFEPAALEYPSSLMNGIVRWLSKDGNAFHIRHVWRNALDQGLDLRIGVSCCCLVPSPCFRTRMPGRWPCGCHPVHDGRCSHYVLDRNSTLCSILFDVYINQDHEQRSPAPCLWQTVLVEMQETIRDDGGIAFGGEIHNKNNQDIRERSSMRIERDRSPAIPFCVCLDPLPYSVFLDQ